MADVHLDTPIGVFGIPSGLMFDARPLTAYMRLSPYVPGGHAWWSRVTPVVDVPLPALPEGVTRDGQSWSVPRWVLVTDPADVRGIVTGQSAVNLEHVQALAAALRPDAPVPWGPLFLARIDDGLWVMDGNHRAAAAVLAGRATHPARVVDLAQLTSCPCGWQATEAGGWLQHSCPQLGLQRAGDVAHDR